VKVRRLHPFGPITHREGVRLQSWLASRVVAKGSLRRKIRLVAAVDCAPAPDGHLHACAVLCEAPTWKVVEEAHAAGEPPMPYVPGLLSFREAPLVLEALRKLRGEPDILLVDGHGRAHPRRLGIASHVGLHVDVPTIGVGKSLLVGVHGSPGTQPGNWAELTDHGERIGLALTTRRGVKPVYVSVGNKIGLIPAARIVLACVTRYRLPEPLRQADLRSRSSSRRARVRS
jgi:deoxyribonuclease V